MFSYLVNKIKNIFSLNKKEKNRIDFLCPGIVVERNQMIRAFENNQKIIKEKCSNCGMNIAKDVECPLCHKKGCAFCFVYNPMDKQYYCEECWNNKKLE